MCGSCAAICPSGINHYSQFMEMRTRMVNDHGEKPAVRSLVYILSREYKLRLAAGVAKFGQKILPDTLREKYNLGNIPLKRFPRMNKSPFRQVLPEENVPPTASKGNILYFTGCATQFLFDGTGFSTVRILNQLGYTVIIPKGQTCCSIPLLYHGAVDQAAHNISANLKCLDQKNIRAIIVDCPTCGAALKNEYPSLSEKLNLDEAVTREISSKVTDIMSFLLTESAGMTLPPVSDKIKVSYHLPCHLKNSPGGQNATEKVLEMIPGIDYIRAADTDACCGGGGTFFYEYPDISKRMVDEKIKHVKETKASIWLTDCPVCRINLSGNLQETDKIRVMHPAEIFNLIKK